VEESANEGREIQERGKTTKKVMQKGRERGTTRDNESNSERYLKAKC